MLRVCAILASFMLAFPAWAYDPNEVVVTGHELPKELENVGVAQTLGAPIDLSLEFTDDHGESGPLGRFFHKGKPVLLAMVYYSCPSLCNFHLNGLTDAIKNLKWNAGQEYEVVAISMNSAETSELAGAKKHNYLKAYGRPDAEKGWHFLVGRTENVQKLADQLGFRFKWLEDKQQYAHASVTYVMTPEGKISRYINGIQPDPTTLKLSMLEASGGGIGTVVEQAMLFCFQFNPAKNKYTLYAWNLMRIGAILMVLVLGVLLLPMWRREQMQNRTGI